jgi:hypothetical protein
MVEGLVGALGVVVLVELVDEFDQSGLGADRAVRVEELLPMTDFATGCFGVTAANLPSVFARARTL